MDITIVAKAADELDTRLMLLALIRLTPEQRLRVTEEVLRCVQEETHNDAIEAAALKSYDEHGRTLEADRVCNEIRKLKVSP